MLKKILFAFLIPVVLIAAAFGIMSVLGSDPPPAPPAKPKPVVQTAAWDGNGSQVLDVATQRASNVLSYTDVIYSSLNTPAVDVEIPIRVSSPTAAKPKWLTPNAFRLSSGDQVVFDPKKVTIGYDGEQWAVNLTYRNLPLERLKAGYDANKNRALGLTAFTPTGSYRVMLLPPPPPTGHEWGEDTGAKPAKGRAFDAEDKLLDRVALAVSKGLEDPRVTARRRAREKAAARKAERERKAQEAEQQAAEDGAKKKNNKGSAGAKAKSEKTG